MTTEERVPQVHLTAELNPAATEDQVRALNEVAPWVMEPHLADVEGTPVAWLYTWVVPLASISSEDGLDRHRQTLEAKDGIRVMRFDPATSDIELALTVQSYNRKHFRRD